MALIGYARVSTVDQNLEVQLEQLQAAGCEKTFSEKRSGSDHRRPALEDCLGYIREGDTLIVTRLDRLARSVSHLHEILKTLEAKGCGFRCIHQPIDTTDAMGRLMFSMLGAFAEFETDIRKERQKEGIERARREGRYAGGGTGAKTGVTVGAVLELRDGPRKMGASAIARELGCGRATIYRAVPTGWGPAPFNGEAG